LLAVRLCAVAGWIEHADDQLMLVAGLERIRDVEAEGVVAAAMRAYRLPVDEDAGFPIDRAKVQPQPLALPGGGDLKLSPVPGALVPFGDAREFGFDREGHQNRTVELTAGRRCVVLLRRGKLPGAVERQPFAAHQLRAWILGQNAIRLHIVGPARANGRAGDWRRLSRRGQRLGTSSERR